MKSEEIIMPIAPCGMNCSTCMAFLREKNNCAGCRGSDNDKRITRIRCKIKTCQYLNSDFCFTCNQFPCKNLMHLDKRYRLKYKMSMIENLENIKVLGIESFLEAEKKRWSCPNCGAMICVHKGFCLKCGKKENSSLN